MSKWTCSAMLAVGVAVALPAAAQAPAVPPAGRFEQPVQEYEAADRAQPAPRGAILFAGDSQFYRWKTIHEDLPGYTLVNRGIDGFQFADLLRYFDRLVLPYKPRLIVLHVGGNDVHNGKPREDIWVEDRVHPNHAGYQIRVKLTRPFLGEPDHGAATAK